MAGAYNRVPLSMLHRAKLGKFDLSTEHAEKQRKLLAMRAYTRCIVLNQANPSSFQAYADALAHVYGDFEAAAAVLRLMRAARPGIDARPPSRTGQVQSEKSMKTKRNASATSTLPRSSVAFEAHTRMQLAATVDEALVAYSEGRPLPYAHTM